MVSEEKKRFVQQLAGELKQSPIVGLLNMHSLPAPQLQNMRATLLKQKVNIIMARKRLLRLAMKDSNKQNIEQLAGKIKGMPALLLASTNPFSLYSAIQKNKSKAPAKAGQAAPKDIVVKAGPTSFAPGPIISELAAVGIKTKVEQGKLAIVGDTIVAKEGDIISPKLAETLKRLDIKPMEIGLDIVAVWEEGMIFDAKQLHVDEAEYSLNFTQAAQWAINLALETAYLTEETTELLLQKAFREAKVLAEESNFLTNLGAGEILSRAEQQAAALQEAFNIEVGEESQISEPVKEAEEVKEAIKEGIKEAGEKVEEGKVKERIPQEAEKEIAEEKVPLAQGLLRAMKERLSEEPDFKRQPHPKQGKVTAQEAESLLVQLQKKGTLRGGEGR